MQSQLPFEVADLNTLNNVKKYLAFLVNTNKAYHLHDDAKDISGLFSEEDADKANKLAARVLELTEGTYLDPFSFFLYAGNVYLYKDHSGRGITSELTDTHIREYWDLTAEHEATEQKLYDFLDGAEVGDNWYADASELIRIK